MKCLRSLVAPAAVVACLAMSLPPVLAADVFVDVTNDGMEDGSQANPYNSIQEGINSASGGDVVRVAAGVYFETIFMRNGISVIGAGASATVIDAGGAPNSAVTFNETKFNPRLQGFTIRNGRGETFVTMGGTITNVGGGIRILNSSPIISENVIEGNLLTNGMTRGAGIYVNSIGESPQIIDNVIRNNTASTDQPVDMSEGGGLFVENKAASIIITGNTFENNRSSTGGGLYLRNTGTSFSSVQRNVFRANSAEIGAAVASREFDASRTVLVNNLLEGNGSAAGVVDCDDDEASTSPGAPEICADGIDNDCDASTPDVFDGDGDGSPCDLDCDDAVAASNPQSAEQCLDGVDNDCDGDIDGADADCACGDGDGDGYSCSDCNDGDPDIHPGVLEVCGDGIDNDCDATTDDIVDADQDGFTCVIDCNDADAAVNPGEPEQGCDSIDNDCNETTPDVFDGDSDGFLCDVDCNDLAIAINPGRSESCFDQIDNNCDGLIDSQDDECSCSNPADLDGDGFRCLDCNNGNAAINPDAQEVCNDGIDNDCDPTTGDIFDRDGDGFFCDVDCGTTDPAVSPGAFEVCNDGIDNDCDGDIDGADADCACADMDGDGYACTDCDDDNVLVNPGQPEICNDTLDNDCDGATPDVFDEDMDGVDCITDCNDRNPITRPGIGENCLDLQDNDCDGLIDVVRTDVRLVQFGRTNVHLANLSDPGIGESWTDPLFNDETWTPGLYGVGYELNAGGAQNLIASTVTAQSDSVYTRARFSIPDVDGINTLWIGADYDDGWAAWINGVEVYRSPELAAGALDWNTVPLSHESSNGTTPDYGTLIDITTVAVPHLVDGTNVLAVGVWNRKTDGNNTSSDLVLVPLLTMDYGADDPDCACVDEDADGYSCSDCDDTNPEINPGMIELGCDFINNDCDASTNDITDLDGDGADCTADCDDLDEERSPFFSEIPCNSVDDDCNPSTVDDRDFDNDSFDCFADCNDNDANINPFATEIACDGIDNDCKPGSPDIADQDGDGAFCDLDCADGDPSIGPDVAEKCDDGIDNDCDDLVDGDDPDCACPDIDLDGYNCDDCNDNNQLINPAAIERCGDTFDNDCNPETPDVGDADGDTFLCDVDCDDTDPFVRPNAAELCNDGIDNDCNPGTPDIFDADGDGAACDVDCNDQVADVNPSIAEVCNDGIDNDCDPLTLDVIDADSDGFDCSFDCDDGAGAVNPAAAEVCNDGIDNDCDPATADVFDADADGSDCIADCADDDALRSPGFAEQCADGIDNDCDGDVDGADADCACGDVDGDFYSCADCNDGDALINPGASEVCNDTIDNDCNPLTPDVGDLDGDGVSCSTDCDDQDPTRSPALDEIGCDGIDNDCNGATPDILDGDLDGQACDVDCDDANDQVSPAEVERLCDGVDNDCNATTSDLGDGDGDAVDCADTTLRGGAIASVVFGSSAVSIVNNTIVNNVMTSGVGGAIFVDDLTSTGESVIANNVIYQNLARVGGGIDATNFVGALTNNGLFGNAEPGVYVAGPGSPVRTGDIELDPEFLAEEASNYRLAPTSPMIDKADSALAPVQDLEQFPRPIDGDNDDVALPDIGAFEFPSGDVLNLRFVSNQDLTWDELLPGASYNVYRGSILRIKLTGSYTQLLARPESEQFCDVPGPPTVLNDPYLPNSGVVVFYLATFRGLTAEGGLGQDSTGAVRPLTRPCP